MKHILHLLLISFTFSMVSCVGYRPAQARMQPRTGHYRDTQLKSYTIFKKDENGNLVKVATVAPDQVGQYQKNNFEWLPYTETHRVVDSRGRAQPAPPGFRTGAPQQPMCYPGGQPYMQMRSPTGHDFNFDPGGRNYPGPYPRLEYIYTHDPRPRR